MKILLSWSSGKDSAWTLHVLQPAVSGRGRRAADDGERGGRSRGDARRPARGPARRRRARPACRCIVVPIPAAVPERGLRSADARAPSRDAVADGFTHVAFGDLFLEDIRRYREERLAGTGLTPLFPSGGSRPPRWRDEMIAGGLRARLTCVDTRVLDAELRRPRVRRGAAGDLPPASIPCGERGEFHTCVYAGPMFNEPIAARDRRDASSATRFVLARSALPVESFLGHLTRQ